MGTQPTSSRRSTPSRRRGPGERAGRQGGFARGGRRAKPRPEGYAWPGPHARHPCRSPSVTKPEAPPVPHDWRPDRFMVIAAHPDDAEFGPAATAARWIADGSEGWLVCCTSGDQGGEDPDADPLAL